MCWSNLLELGTDMQTHKHTCIWMLQHYATSKLRRIQPINSNVCKSKIPVGGSVLLEDNDSGGPPWQTFDIHDLTWGIPRSPHDPQCRSVIGGEVGFHGVGSRHTANGSSYQTQSKRVHFGKSPILNQPGWRIYNFVRHYLYNIWFWLYVYTLQYIG